MYGTNRCVAAAKPCQADGSSAKCRKASVLTCEIGSCDGSSMQREEGNKGNTGSNSASVAVYDVEESRDADRWAATTA